jgi:hypothetical protein
VLIGRLSRRSVVSIVAISGLAATAWKSSEPVYLGIRLSWYKSVMRAVPHGLARRILALAALVIVPYAAAAAWPAAASQVAAGGGKLSLTSLAFAQPDVDASGGGAVVDLNWTVKDSSSLATTISGDLKIRLAGAERGTYVGQTYDVPFSLPGSTPGVTSSGTAQASSYSYGFTVPQYSFASTAHWVVIRVTVKDDKGETLNLSGNDLNRYSGVLTATELTDSTPPTYDSLAFPVQIGPSRPYVYDDGSSGGSSSYTLNGDDAQSGFWKGVLTLLGPSSPTRASLHLPTGTRIRRRFPAGRCSSPSPPNAAHLTLCAIAAEDLACRGHEPRPQRRWRKDLNLVPEAGQPVRRSQLVLERQRHNPPAVRIGPKRRLERRSDPRPEDLGKDRDRLGRGAERDLKPGPAGRELS